MAFGGGQAGSTPLPPLPGHLLPTGCSIPMGPRCRVGGSHRRGGDERFSESCSSRDGAGVAQPCPSHPCSPLAATRGRLSASTSPPASPQQRCEPRPLSPNTLPAMEGQCGWEGRGFSGLCSPPRGGGAAPSCPAVPAGLSSSQSRGVARICCGLAAPAGLGFR